MLVQRVITAAVGIPVILAVVLIGGVAYTIVAAAILSVAALELVAMLAPSGESPRPFWQPSFAGVAAVLGVVLVVAGADTGGEEWTAAIVAGVGLGFLAALLRQPVEGAVDWVAVVAAVVYVGFLGSYLVLLRDLDDDGEWILLAVLATWVADTFAYFTGKLIGRKKMAPRISPGKTWEGTAGGIVGAIVAVVAVDAVLDLPMSTGEDLWLGAMLGPVAVLADLGESMLKRGAGVKDTSELVPGHGGLLDRLDSILFTVPLVYYFAIWVVF